ncbi:MAG: hypothetical protein ACR2P6_11335, partial [Gammaproteobacteria bacterium]
MQSPHDTVVPVGVVTGTRDLWVLYNGFELDVFGDGIVPPCVDYSLGASVYPVQWCLHDTPEFDGHGWWTGADQAIWGFFTSLPVQDLTAEPPPGGGNDRLTENFPTTMTITVDLPETLGVVRFAGLFLYPEGSELPISGAPLYILNGGVDLGDATPGTQITLDMMPVKLPPDDELPANFTMVLAVYVEGGSSPIPTPGIDHNVIYDITINDSTMPIIIDDILFLEPVQAE